MALLEQIFGSKSTRAVKSLAPIVAEINRVEAELASLSPGELLERMALLKQKLSEGSSLDELVVPAFALVREASKRTLGQRHFDVQLMGGIVMHQGGIAEMKTGEGKTLVATLPACLNALTGKGAHIVTVNDYLARRDAVWMGQIYHALGLSVGVVTQAGSYRYTAPPSADDAERDTSGAYHIEHEFLVACTKREAYACDVTYGTNNEYGFDYLRDNIAFRPEDLAQREYAYAIVDEIDSILIDEARTPLIISAPSQESEALYHTFARIATTLTLGEDYTVDEKAKAILVTDQGISRAEKLLGVGNIYTEHGVKYVHHLETAIRAKALYERDREYVVGNDGVVIVDEFTGRLQPGRRWSEGLHQAIEAKEGVAVQRESRTVASITFQNYFRMYTKLSGMTGTAATSAEEFRKVYGLEVLSIPSNAKIARVDLPDQIFKNERGKVTAVVRRVRELHEKGQPVLVGSISIEKNEIFSSYLNKEGIPHQVLNAKNHEREGEIIADAGRKGSVVIATNMAGRGVDIKLGGAQATKEEYEEVKALGGLFVLGTERHEARRIDNQLRGRAGRQGDPGATQFFISMEDELARVFGPGRERIKAIYDRFGVAEDEPMEARMITRIIENAQNKIEGLNFDARKHVLEYDDVMNHQRGIMYVRRRKLLIGNQEYMAEFADRLKDHASTTGEASEIASVVETKEQELGREMFLQAVRQLALQTLDTLWMEHLEAMDYLRGSVNLRAYGQRDPLVEYKKEGLRLYKDLEFSLFDTILKHLERVAPAAAAFTPVIDLSQIKEGGPESAQVSRNDPASSVPKVGRNDPCPCGSGKKYKKCHGK
ncbi:MAG: Protein translocase subunit SecA [Parcubacteria group bacterium GW2011_GWF2_52_12]|nr:MAG: Protein translocase subunit SecA [Parcubacteria group bacterium GW2011_GWF2_52_12]